MASPSVPQETRDASGKKNKEAPSRSCPAACGSFISGRDGHPLCIVCMGISHAKLAVANLDSCATCSGMSSKTLERRLRVAAAPNAVPPLSASLSGDAEPAKPPSRSWGDIMDSSDFPPLLTQLDEDVTMGGLGDEDDDVSSDILAEDPEDDDDDAILPHQPSRPPSSQSGTAPTLSPDVNLHDVCRRAADRLALEWPAPQSGQGPERDLYDGKVLPSSVTVAKQLMPVVPACLREVKRYWDKPLRHRVPVKGFSGLDIQGMEELGLSNPPPVEPSVASHLHPDRRATMSASGPSLPGKMDRLTASMYQKIYRSSAQAVRALNVVTLLSAYHAELLVDMGQQLDSGSPNPAVWEEICVTADLILRSSRGAVQGSGRSMGLAVAGERSLWLNLSSLADKEKQDIMDAQFDPSKGLFGPAIETMKRACDVRKKEGEAFNLCLPRKPAPRPQQPPRQSFAATARSRQPHTPYVKPEVRTENPEVRNPRSKPWGKQSFAAAAARNRPSHPPDGKKRRPT